MDYSFSTIGALLGLAVSIVLIIKKVQKNTAVGC